MRIILFFCIVRKLRGIASCILVADTETKTLRCLADMEVNGLGICKKSLQDFANNLKELLIALERQANSLAGQKVSLASSKQVAKAIGLYKGKRISLNKQTLQDNDNPISSIVIHWRKLNSILTKIVYPLLQVIKNDRIYPCCITHNATGRITMHEPNVQNVARNFEMVNPASQEIVQISCRSAFKSAEGYILLSADYCQLELRILTHLSEDKLLCSIMKSEEDVFRSIAAKWNNISEEEVRSVYCIDVLFILHNIPTLFVLGKRHSQTAGEANLLRCNIRNGSQNAV